MKVVSQKYKETMSEIIRPTTQFQARLEMTDRSVEDNATAVTPQKMPFATSIFDTIHEGDYITFEKDSFKVGSNLLIAPYSNYLLNGFVSEEISDQNGVFTEIPTFEFTFNEIKSFIGMTYSFSIAYSTQIRVTYFVDGVQKGQFISNPTSLYFVDEENHIPECDRITFEFLSMSEPYRRLRIAKLLFGLEKVFTTEDITSTSHTISIDPISSSLPQENLSMTVTNYDLDYNPDNPKGIWRYFKNGLPLRVRYGTTANIDTNEIEWVDAAYLYMSDTPKADGKSATFTATDKISTLTNTYYKGLYRQQGISLYDLAVDVLTDAGVYSYEIPTFLQGIYTEAIMPVVTHKEALQLIANAGRCVLYTKPDGTIKMRLQLNSDVTVIDNGHYKWSSLEGIYNGGSRVDYITFEPNKWRVGNNNLYISTENSEDYKNVGFISEDMSDGSGNFQNPPKIYVNYSLPVSSYRFSVGFDSVNQTGASNFNIIFLNGDTEVKRIEVRNNTEVVYTVNEEIIDYTRVIIEILSTINPYNRIRVETINEGQVTDYYLDFNTAMVSPIVSKTEELKSVDVTAHSYTVESAVTTVYQADNVEINGVKELQIEYDLCTNAEAVAIGGELLSATYYANTAILTISAESNVKIVISANKIIDNPYIVSTVINPTGEICPIDNPLISNRVLAILLGEWVGNYLKHRNCYETNYRQDFRLDANDIIYIQSDFAENIPARIVKLQYNLPGQEGAISVRRMT